MDARDPDSGPHACIALSPAYICVRFKVIASSNIFYPVPIPDSLPRDTVSFPCNLNTWQVEAARSCIRGHPKQVPRQLIQLGKTLKVVTTFLPIFQAVGR